MDKKKKKKDKAGKVLKGLATAGLVLGGTVYTEKTVSNRKSSVNYDKVLQRQYVIAGRQTAQRNLLFEYQEEAFRSFSRMFDVICDDIARNIFLGDPMFGRNGEMYVLFP